MRVAVDIDGVLADQVGSVLKRIERDYGLTYQKSDVDRAHWTFSGKDIWTEISICLRDPEYVRTIPVIEGAISAIEQLAAQELCVVTARRPETEKATREWLGLHFPRLTEYHHARTGSKQTISSDVLIDDFDLNIVEFVKSHPDRRGILFEQPWSLNDIGIDDYAHQVHSCRGWPSVLQAIEAMMDDGHE